MATRILRGSTADCNARAYGENKYLSSIGIGY
jgi:hypothetical protein